jgi:hypothetical protein
MTKPLPAYVAMFDFLGFKQLRQEKGTAGLYSLYQSLFFPIIQHAAAQKAKTVEQNGQSVYVPDFGDHSVLFRVVSDSILLFSKAESFDDFVKIVGASHSLLCGGFAGHGAPLRGAIGFGDLIFDTNSIWIGSAIEDAYAGESSQLWSGCSLSAACEEHVRESGYVDLHQRIFSDALKNETDSLTRTNLSRAARRIVDYPIPHQINPKEGPVQYMNRNGLALNWTTNVYEGASEKAFAATTNIHSKQIQKNTIEFEAWARSLSHEF